MDCKDNEAEEDSTIPDFKDTGVYVLPEYTDSAFRKVIQAYQDLFRNTPGKTTLACTALHSYFWTGTKGTTTFNQVTGKYLYTQLIVRRLLFILVQA